MSNKIILRSVGASNTTNLVKCSLEKLERDKTILFLGYSPNSQDNIIKEIREVNGFVPKNFRIKNWFNFLLEDVIHPYQSEIYNKLTRYVVFYNDTEATIDENATVIEDETNGIAKKEYFHKNGIRSMYVSEFATKLCNASKFPVMDRIASIYPKIYIDDANKLEGWDFSVLELILANQNVEIYCTGDFRKIKKESRLSNSEYLEKIFQNREWFAKNGFQIVENYCTPLKINIKLLEAMTKEFVDGEILNDISQQNLDEIEKLWLQPKSFDNAQLHKQTQNIFHQNWNEFLRYSVVANGKLQAIMLLSTGKYSQTDKSKELLYIDHISVAPWNQSHSNSTEKLLGLGSVLLLLAFHVSRFIGFEGRLGLHSLPQTIDFFEEMGMRNCGIDSEYGNLTYFELVAEQGNELVGIGDQL